MSFLLASNSANGQPVMTMACNCVANKTRRDETSRERQIPEPTPFTDRRPLNDAILTVDGYGLHLAVGYGHLGITDGIGPHRRTRILPRAQRTVRRIVILGHTGTVTLDAVRWCADTGIALIQIDGDGRVLIVGNNPARTDSRLLRAQAAAAGSAVGVAIARQLLGAKVDGQAAIAHDVLTNTEIATVVRALAADLRHATDLRVCRDLESHAANAYFAAWTTVCCRFTKQSQDRVPRHWHQYTVRSSPLSRSGHSPRNAADPINALLNYGYALAEAEARIAALAVGLDPGLGILHTDQKHRDSLALDLLEPLRPVVEGHVLQLLGNRHFTAADFVETREGRCRLRPPLTHEIAEQLLPALARAVAGPAEAVAHILAGSSPSKIHLSTPLSRTNTSNAQLRGQRTAHRREAAGPTVRPSCEKCGVDLYGSARKLCPTCWPVVRADYLRQLGKAGAKPTGPAKPTRLSSYQVAGPSSYTKPASCLPCVRSPCRTWNARPGCRTPLAAAYAAGCRSPIRDTGRHSPLWPRLGS
jgi:CRISPR-associated endonuclease Cas1